MITCRAHTPNGEGLHVVEADRIEELLRAEDQVLWLDLEEPVPEDFDLLRREFGFHPLALEDAHRRHQRPKIDEYPTFYFLVIYAFTPPHHQAHDEELVHLEEISIFLGKNYIVTVHVQPIPELEEAVERWRQVREEIGAGPGALLYAILDSIVDQYFLAVDGLSDRIDALEERIFQHFDPALFREVFKLRKDLLELRHVLAPEREVINTLLRRENSVLPPQVAIYLQDVYDHLLRVTDAVDIYRELLSGSLDAYLSTASNNLSNVMRTLTAGTIVLMSMSVIGSVYGMNFRHMPELEWPWGYPMALGLMTIIGGGLALYFWRKGWFSCGPGGGVK